MVSYRCSDEDYAVVLGDEMTWGSNASGMKFECPYCGGDAYDDTDEGPSTHELNCSERFIWKRIKKFFGVSNLPKARLLSSLRKIK